MNRVKVFKEDNAHTRVVTPEEERLFLMAASQPLRDFATLIVDTGIRPEEVTRIERSNVFFAQGYL